MRKLWYLLGLVACVQSQPILNSVPEDTIPKYVPHFPTTLQVPDRNNQWILDSLSMDAWNWSLETAACITRWEVDHDTIKIRELKTFVPATRTLTHIDYMDEDCRIGCPLIHWHIVRNDLLRIPSNVDTVNSLVRKIPFGVLGVAGTSEVNLVLVNILADSEKREESCL